MSHRSRPAAVAIIVAVQTLGTNPERPLLRDSITPGIERQPTLRGHRRLGVDEPA